MTRARDLPAMFDPGNPERDRRRILEGKRLCAVSPIIIEAFLDKNPDLRPLTAWNTVWVEGILFSTLELK